MLADIVDHVIGIDPDRDQITASLVEASTGGELATAAFETTRGGYERLVAWADRHSSSISSMPFGIAGSMSTPRPGPRRYITLILMGSAEPSRPVGRASRDARQAASGDIRPCWRLQAQWTASEAMAGLNLNRASCDSVSLKLSPYSIRIMDSCRACCR